MRTFGQQQHGFTLVESLIAMLIFVIGGLAMAGLIGYGIRLQTFARDGTKANATARAKIEELRVIPRSDPRRALGGGLDANVADHFDTPSGTPFTRRWLVADGPKGTQDLTIAVSADSPNVRLPVVQVRVVLP